MSASSLSGGSVRVLWDAPDTAMVTITGVGPIAFTVNGGAVTFPYLMSTSTTFDTAISGKYTVSVQHHGYEVADTPDAARNVELAFGQQVTFSPSPDGTPDDRFMANLYGALATTYVAPTAIAKAATYGNDSTDAKAHFQSLMDTLSASGGGTLFIPRGTYRLSGALGVPSNVTVRGEGRSTVLKATYSASGVIYNKNWNTAGGDTNITVTDLCVDGNGTASQGVTFAGVKRGTIHDVRVKNCTGYGIWLWAQGEDGASQQGLPSEQCTVSSCHITDVVDTGIEIDAAIRCTVIGNTIEASAGRGLYAWNGATDNTFTGNVVVGTGSTGVTAMQVAGITGGATYARQSARNTFVGNTASGAISYAIKVSDVAGNATTDSVFDGNVCTTTVAASSGVQLDYAMRVRVTGNTFDNFGTPVRISTPSSGGNPGSVRDVMLARNTFNGGGTSNIYGVTSGQIDGNQWINQTNHCVQFYAVTGLTIIGNAFVDAGSGSNMTAMIFYDYNSASSSGNVVTGNRTFDTRATKWLGNVVTLAGGADYNIFTNNSARGARAGGQALQNTGTGVNNVIANNVNA